MTFRCAHGCSVIAVGVAGLWLVACSEPPQPVRRPQGLLPGEEVPRGPVQLPNPAPAPTTPPPQQRSALKSPFEPAAPNPGALARDGGPDTGSVADADAAALAGPPRDLPAELRGLIGQPGSCLDLAAAEAGGGKLTISATANVSTTGRVTRVKVDAPNQPASALSCLEKRIASGSLRGPIPNAPTEITTTVVVEVYGQPSPR